jgi:hypothetical protein
MARRDQANSERRSDYDCLHALVDRGTTIDMVKLVLLWVTAINVAAWLICGIVWLCHGYS